MKGLFVDGRWIVGAGPALASTDPASGEVVWIAGTASPSQSAAALNAARRAARGWATTPLEERVAAVRRFACVLKERRNEIAEMLSREMGKLLWETRAEVGSMAAKVEVSIAAQAERAGTRLDDTAFGRAALRHRPHGVMVVLGPYNFPGHLPNGHIVPALLAGNTIVFKPSEKMPMAGEMMAVAWEAAGLPDGVFNLVQGGRGIGEALIAADIDGLLFTGSAVAGAHFRRVFAHRPHVLLALELGGNNPLVVWETSDATASIILQSAFVTTGQRCSCARRLIVPAGPVGDAIVDALVAATERVAIGAWNDPDDAFIGPLIDEAAAKTALAAAARLRALGSRLLVPFRPVTDRPGAFVRPGIEDVTGLDVPDAEIFAPLLQVTRVHDFARAVEVANDTRSGLSAGLVSANGALWNEFVGSIRASVVNWNRPTTGAASDMPFGGLGESGNHRPSAYYAADYCAYPVASFESATVEPVDVSGARPDH